MAKHLDVGTVLRHVVVYLVQQLFTGRAEVPDLPLAGLQATRRLELIWEAWQQQPEDRRREIQAVFRGLMERGEKRDVRAFVELLTTRILTTDRQSARNSLGVLLEDRSIHPTEPERDIATRQRDRNRVPNGGGYPARRFREFDCA
jgi:hypothetical protein